MRLVLFCFFNGFGIVISQRDSFIFKKIFSVLFLFSLQTYCTKSKENNFTMTLCRNYCKEMIAINVGPPWI